MSLLLDALKQAEKQKNSENVVEEQPVSSNTVDFSLNSPSVEPTESPVQGIDLAIQDTVDDATISTDAVDEVVDECKTSDIEKSNEATIVSPDSTFIETTENNNGATLQGGTLDPSLNVFAVGSRRSNKVPKNKLIGVIYVIVLLFLLAIGWLYFNETVTDNSEQLLEGDPLIEERIQEEKAKKAEQMSTQLLPAESKEVQQNTVKQVETIKSVDSQEEQGSPDAVVGIKIKKRTISTGLYKQLNEAYNAMEKGQFESAKISYQRALTVRPNSIDALLGLANIESRDGNIQRARELYEQVLTQQETNTTAQIGLLHTYSDKAPLAKQQILENLSSKYPENPEILMALGQSFSSQSKWLKAQDAYFRGFSIQPDSVMFAYNLGVSLDQLGKISAAKTYYQKTINLNSLSVNPIDMSAINKRLNELEVAKNE